MNRYGKPRRPLLLEEVPEKFRDFFLWDQQYIPPTGRTRIPRICIWCKERFESYSSQIRSDIKRGRKTTGLCSRCSHSSGLQQRGIRGKFKTGRHKNFQGYIAVWLPDHPAAHAGYVLEHRVVMELLLGRYLEKHEQVHHKNGKRDDNRPENLELWKKSQPSGVRVSDYHCPGCRCS